MSVDARFTAELVPEFAFELVEALVASGWSAGRNASGYACVPAGEDTSEWQPTASLALTELRALFEAKLARSEAFGVRLFWRGGGVGGELLLFINGQALFTPSLDRITLEDDRTTDVSWYLARLMPALRAMRNSSIERWAWEETA